MSNRLLIIGGGRGLDLIVDVLSKCAEIPKVAGVVDDNKYSTGNFTRYDLDLIGTTNDINDLWGQDKFDEMIISVSSSIEFRKKIFDKYKGMIPFANIIDPSVNISYISNKTGTGNVILGNSRIGPHVEIGNNNFISAFTNIEHHNKIGNHNTFGPGVMTSGRVVIEDEIKFGTGIFIEPGVKIGKNSIISSGAVLISDVLSNSIVKTKTNQVVRKINE